MKHIKKGTFLALGIALLLPLAARAAEPTLNIKELREQTPAYWQGEYTNSKGRRVSFNAPILMPTADTFPVARVVRNYSTEEALAPYADGKDEDSDRSSVVNITRLNALYDSGKDFGWETTDYYYNLWEEKPQADPEQVFAPEQSISLAGAGEWLDALVREIYGEEYDAILDTAKVKSATYETVKKKGRVEKAGPLDMGDMTGKGHYELYSVLTLDGIPLLGGPKYITGFSLRNAENLLDSNSFNAQMPIYGSENYFSFYGQAYSVQEVIEPDVPLCSFEEIQKSIEKLIDRDKVQKVYSLKLGWVYWLDPAVEYPKKDGQRAEGLRMPFLATPVWVVECVYASGTGVDYTEYEEYEESQQNPNRWNELGHRWIMINAQTGEAYAPWNDSTQRKYAPKVITW